MAADRNEDSKVKDGSAVSEKVLFVRNLPFSTKDQDLENIFSDVGPIRLSFSQTRTWHGRIHIYRLNISLASLE